MTQIAEYRTLVDAKGYDGLSSTIKDAAINAGRRRIFTDRRWKFLDATNTALVTVAGTATVSLSTITDLQHIDAIRLFSGTEEIPLDYISQAEMRDEQAQYLTTDTDEPCYWTRRGSNLILSPTPDKVYTLNVDYVDRQADLSGVTEDVIPEDLADLVVWAALPDLAFRQRDQWAGQYAERQYQVLRAAAIGQEEMSQRQTSRQVRSGYWGTARR